ncbi:MAG: class I SAM-dependent methyltransferase [Pseudomonadota bacterium]
MASGPTITQSDLSHRVEMGRIHGNYFSDEANAQAFIEIAIRPLLEGFGPQIRHAGFGGGDGFLTKKIAETLRASGRAVETLVVDANQHFLEQAEGRGLATLKADLRDVYLADYDLITMRSVNHYNTLSVQQEILDDIFRDLKPGGLLASQNLSGPSGRYCVLCSRLTQFPSLGRIKGQVDLPHMTSEPDFTLMMERAGFAEIRVAGYAPEIPIGPEIYWARFNAKAQTDAEAVGDKAALDALAARRATYLAETAALIGDFLSDANRAEAAMIEPTECSYQVYMTYPIFTGRRP